MLPPLKMVVLADKATVGGRVAITLGEVQGFYFCNTGFART
ncbi:hypothetical protein HMPREF1868_00559 [Olsenella sp. DNF00959]|nr:hypothetical protein HMPREF1868_00559 [Olsenella sp. DNF00959]